MDIRHTRFNTNDSTPTLIFSGRGKVQIRSVAGPPFMLGSASLSQSNGFLVAGVSFQLELVSDSEIWALNQTGEGNGVLHVLAVD
jgi:hypothetical protein